LGISELGIRRLCRIVGVLECLALSGRELIFSDEISQKTGTPAYLVRKDISCLGIHMPGRGYHIKELLGHLTRALTLSDKKEAVLAGAGKLGSALLNCQSPLNGILDFAAAFDSDPLKIGRTVNGVDIRASDEMLAFLSDRRVDIGVVAVPPESAQTVSDTFVTGGISAILNLAPVQITVPAGISLRSLDFALEMKLLTAAKNREG
jgi:redox-sensing transcriptional repressor